MREAIHNRTSSGGSLVWQGVEIPSLYGIRGLAALTVVLGHIGVTSPDSGGMAVI